MGKFERVWVTDERSHYDFIDKLFRGLGNYYEDFLCATNEAPYSYSERTFVGHLAQSACRNRYYSIQDYNVNADRSEVSKNKKPNYIPDLHIWIPRNKNTSDTCVFEVKTTYASPIDKDPDERSETILSKLNLAEKQLDDQGFIEGKYRCGLVASPVHCCHRKWKYYGKNPRAYAININKIKRSVGQYSKWPDANFIWSYFMDYEQVSDLSWKSEGTTYLPWIGIICVGKVQTSH